MSRNSFLTLCALLLGGLLVYAVLSKPGIILIKPGNYEQYKAAVLPCPGYPHPVIVQDTNGEALADCDGDGLIDEIASLPPSGNGPFPYKRNWIFVLRPGVHSVRLAGGSDSPPDVGIYPSTSILSRDAQQRFELLRSKAPH